MVWSPVNGVDGVSYSLPQNTAAYGSLVAMGCLFSLQYSYLLSSQLETQRLFFEEKMACIEKDITKQVSGVGVVWRRRVGGGDV